MKISKKAIAKFQEQERRRDQGHIANNRETAGMVKDRRTGEWYNPQERFDAMMNKPEIQAVFNRLAVR